MIGELAELGFNGLAYGIVLFFMACGLSITMGLMGFANLAHGATAMLGGYVLVVAMRDLGLPFLASLPAAFAAAAVAGALFEMTICRRLHAAGELDQVLLTIGVVFMAIAAATFGFGAGQQAIVMPGYLTGRLALGPIEVSAYRLFLLVLGAAITIGLVTALERSRLGVRIRAAVDNRAMTTACGIDVGRLFTLVFALGSGLGGLGGALSVNLVGLDPSFPLKYLVFIMIVVTVGGFGSMTGTLVAALLLGLADVACKYFLPEAGAFAIFAVTAIVLYWRPQGLFGRVA